MGNRKKIKQPAAPLPRREQLSALLDTFSKIVYKYNGYICNTCDGAFLSVDLDEGTTPPETQCLATEGCGGKAISMGYPEGEPPENAGPPVIEWYRPDAEEYAMLPPEIIQYVEDGGLLRRAGKDAPDWVKAIA